MDVGTLFAMIDMGINLKRRRLGKSGVDGGK